LTQSATVAERIWLDTARQRGADHWLANVRGCVEHVFVGTHALPLVLPEHQPQASYVACPVSAWARYPHDESRRFGRAGYLAATPVASSAAAWMRAAGLHRAASLGNWLVSTNLHPSSSSAHWRQAREAAVALAPDRPLVIRNVCPSIDAALAAALVEDGWLMTPARRVYLCDPASSAVARRNNVKNDRRALNKSHLERVGPDALGAADVDVLRHLFRQLFIDKHSGLNPDFTPAFFAHCLEHRFVELHGLRHAGRLVGVVGLLRRHGWMTSPLLGYDLRAPRALGLYRALMALSFEEACRVGARLHLSAGAGEFKRARGGVPALEYSAIHVEHLPPARRVTAKSFHALMQRAVPPLLRRFA